MKETVLDTKLAKSILENNLKREYKTYSKNASFSNSAKRFNKDKISDRQKHQLSFITQIKSFIPLHIQDTWTRHRYHYLIR